MFRSRILLAMFLLSLLLAACSLDKPAPLTPPATSTLDTKVAGESAAGTPESARVFPSQDWEWGYNFDDGTKETHEWWLRDASRVVAANQNGVYAVWHIAPGGIYRRDPLGGPQAPLLRYLPARLEDNIAWQQISGDATVKFWLRRAGHCGDFEEDWIKKSTAPCWDLEVLNRDQKQRFFWREGAGVVAASMLPPAHPLNSYHKRAWGDPAKPQRPASRAEWLAAADKLGAFAEAKVASTQPLTPEQFQADVAATIKSAVLAVQLDAPQPLYLIGALNVPLDSPLLILQDAGGEHWIRNAPPAIPCTYRVQRKPFAYLLELCGKPTDSAASVEPAIWIRGWYRRGSEITYVPWPEHPATTDRLGGMRIDVAENGQVILQQAVSDPLHHIHTTVYELKFIIIKGDGEAHTSAQASQYGLPAEGLVYPSKAEDVLLAAFFARWHDLTQELPTFFATPAEAERFLHIDLTGVIGLDPSKMQIGRLEAVQTAHTYDPAVKITPAAAASDQTMDFLFESDGCCDSFSNVWGKVQLHLSDDKPWKISHLDLQFAQSGGGVKPIPHPN